MSLTTLAQTHYPPWALRFTTETPSTVRLVVIALHVLALLLWVGSLASITRVLGAMEDESGSAVNSALLRVAKKIHAVVSSPWMVIALMTGVGLTLTMPQNARAQLQGASGLGWLLRQRFYWGKLLGTTVLVGLHLQLRNKIALAESLSVSGRPRVRGIQLGVLLVSAWLMACVYPWQGSTVFSSGSQVEVSVVR